MTHADKRPSLGRELREWGRSFAVSLLLVLLVYVFVFSFSIVRGHSMEPTLAGNEWLFVNKIEYVFGHPHRGEVVILSDPAAEEGHSRFLVKRVVAVPGDRVEIQNRRLYINGAQADEAYTDTEIQNGDFGPLVIPRDRYFVMGDNRHWNASEDSRVFGPVSSDRIKGRAQWIVWPFSRMHGL